MTTTPTPPLPNSLSAAVLALLSAHPGQRVDALKIFEAAWPHQARHQPMPPRQRVSRCVQVLRRRGWNISAGGREAPGYALHP